MASPPRSVWGAPPSYSNSLGTAPSEALPPNGSRRASIDPRESAHLPVEDDPRADESTALLSGGDRDKPKEVVGRLCPQVMKREAKILGKLAWPVTAGYVMQMSLSLAAVFSVGHLGKKELASAALANMFCNVTGYSIGIGMSSALDTLCSQAHTGSSDPHAVGKHLQRAIVVMAALCFPVGLIWWFADSILLLLGQDPEIAALSAKFSRWALIGLFPYLVNECLKRFLQCQGIMKANMAVILIASPINIFLQWLLVWSPIGLGVIGAPIATGITFCLLPVATWGYIMFVDGGE
ncbi:hypothetical protein HK097_003874, partial [Rhizophlyctis rosea]